MASRPALIIVGVAALAALAVSCGGSDDSADTSGTGAVDSGAVDSGVTSTVVPDVVVTGAPAAPADPETLALANELMSASVQANLGLPEEQADCAAVFMVNAIGADVLVVDGELVDLDLLPPEAQQAAAVAFTEAVPNCGITVPTTTG